MVAPSAGGSRLPWQRTPTTNPFLTNSKKIRRSKHATNTHKHGRGSYLSDGTHGDSRSHLEAEPLRSKDRGFFSYNIEDAYMPCDNRRCNYVNPEYQNAIESIDMLIAQHPESEYMIGADWNTDIGRRNAQTLCFYEFIERNGLFLCWNHRNSKQDYTYINHDLGHCSCVDHFILSMGL